MATDEEAAEMAEWIEKLWERVHRIRVDYVIWEEVQAIINANRNLHVESHFYGWLRDMYVSGISMAIRRQADIDTRTDSLRRFLQRIKGDPSLVSRDRYRKLYEGSSAKTQLESLGDEVTGQDEFGNYVDAIYDKLVGVKKEKPTADDVEVEIQGLTKVTENFADFASKVVGHDDKIEPADVPTFGDVEIVLAHLEKLVEKYFQLLKATSRSTDVNFQYDWKRPFRVPWIE